MNTRTLLLALAALALLVYPAYAQDDDDDFDPDSVYYTGPSGGGGGFGGAPGIGGSGGVYGGPTFELSALEPSTLDPDLSGSMIIYGGQGMLILGNWVLGGGGYSADIFDMPSNYDEFVFSYGGFLFGYDRPFGDFSLRGVVLIGGGELKMIKKAPDLGDPLSNGALEEYQRRNGVEVLERFREEDFFALRPTLSLGFAPLPFFDIRVAASYLMPLGGEDVDDLYTLSYGVQLMFGFGR